MGEGVTDRLLHAVSRQKETEFACLYLQVVCGVTGAHDPGEGGWV